MSRRREDRMSRIVVGVDGSPGSRGALAWALEEARLRGAVLRAVHAWMLPFVPAASSGFVPAVVRDEAEVETFEQLAREALDETLAEVVGDEHAGLAIERELVQARAAEALVAASRDADLLVVGSRGLGGFKELLLGSVSHQCALHAACPVVIVRKGEP
jgi:nucleotide-binding universal stress UspA family protein